MQIREAMIPREKLITADQEIRTIDAMNILVVNRIGSLVITDDSETVIGIVTSRDLMQVIVTHEADGLQIKLKDVMSTKLLTVNENDQLTTAVKKMDEYQTHHILVKDNSGMISGLLSSFDIVREKSLDALRV